MKWFEVILIILNTFYNLTDLEISKYGIFQITHKCSQLADLIEIFQWLTITYRTI